MFQHVTVLISFIFALALTHVFSSASNLILQRDRVCFSGLLAMTMLNAVLGILNNWLFLWQLETLQRWTLSEVLLQLIWVIPLYFTLSLVAMPAHHGEPLDMRAFYERQRPAIYGAFIVFNVMGVIEIYGDRHNLAYSGPNEWVGAALTNVGFALCSLVAGWSKARWLQWIGVGGMFVGNIWFLSTYTLNS